MAAYNCNGICHRHPSYSSKRLVGRQFRDNVDAICRKCEAYFKNFKDRFCPCCKQRLGRHTRRTKAYIIQRMLSGFADFWRRILGEIKQYKPYRRMESTKPNRICLICNSNVTFTNNRGYEMWTRFAHGFICQKCYNREQYRTKARREFIPLPLQSSKRGRRTIKRSPI